MEHYRTITLRLFCPSDKAVFSSLLTLLSLRTCDHWALVESNESDVSVVDTDNVEGELLARELEQQGHCVIRYRTPERSSLAIPRTLFKPLRAANILRCLRELEEMDFSDDVVVSNSVVTPVSVATAYRLLRWPGKEILSAFPTSSRLCAVFLKQPMTVNSAATIANLPIADVEAFCFACQEQQLMSEHAVSASSLSESCSSESNKHTVLFDELRNKFSSRA